MHKLHRRRGPFPAQHNAHHLAALIGFDPDDNGVAAVDRALRLAPAIDALLRTAHAGGERDYHRRLAAAILPLGRARAAKDRAWFAPMGFDSEMSA